MIRVRFKNLERSELTAESVRDRFSTLIGKFPDLSPRAIEVTVEMENSPLQAGPDAFTVTASVTEGRFRGVRLKKRDGNFYVALARVVDHLFERLSRESERTRVRQRKKAARWEVITGALVVAILTSQSALADRGSRKRHEAQMDRRIFEETLRPEVTVESQKDDSSPCGRDD